MSTVWAFDGIENMHDVHRDKYGMKRFCVSFKEQAMKINKFGKKKMLPSNNKEYTSYHNQKTVTFYKSFGRVRDHCHYTDKCHYTELLHIVYVICNKVHLKKFLWLFTMDQSMIINLQ